ncbi:MAG: c-type cytochrome biogenesis protein CcmI [Hyphomicrobiales bacterium]|nr:c-type cytochrome biogenesis protein CcmI [Hyphomicrobiales bacterium]MCP4998421.1 c-type cytochrome biogenesis protein CcmI [Hyphomicrobiales bacterium]
MTVAATTSLLVPLARRTKLQAAEKEFDAEVYHDQLREIDRDIESGLLTGEEAEYARAEVGRRLIKASKAASRKTVASSPLAGAARYVVIVFLPLMAVAGYLAIGSPGMPSQPLAARIQPPSNENSDIANLVAQAETHLASNPEDGRGWDVLAPVYFSLGRVQDSEIAYRNAIRLLGSTAPRQAGLGQSLFAQTGGIVTADVQAAFQAADDLEPGNPLSSFFLALGMAQEGKLVEARTAFSDLAGRSTPDAPWMPQVRLHLEELDKRIGQGGEEAVPGPDKEQVAAAAQMSDDERREMIGGIVAGLDERLRENPDDLEGWLRLIRSYMVLGEAEQAGDALNRALENFDAGSAGRQALTQAATQFGLAAEKVNQ